MAQFARAANVFPQDFVTKIHVFLKTKSLPIPIRKNTIYRDKNNTAQSHRCSSRVCRGWEWTATPADPPFSRHRRQTLTVTQTHGRVYGALPAT